MAPRERPNRALPRGRGSLIRQESYLRDQRRENERLVQVRSVFDQASDDPESVSPSSPEAACSGEYSEPGGAAVGDLQAARLVLDEVDPVVTICPDFDGESIDLLVEIAADGVGHKVVERVADKCEFFGAVTVEIDELRDAQPGHHI